VRVRFDLDTDADADVVDKLIELTERYCVVLQTVRTATRVDATTHPVRPG
jgi:uncharacterized OsmC-like protein